MRSAGDGGESRLRTFFSPIVVGAVGLVFGIYLALSGLAAYGGNPTGFVKFPEIDEQSVDYAEELLGDVVLAPGFGHDGKYYFIQAMDPLYLNPDSHAYLLDRPTYRAQRMLYPTIAGGFGWFSPNVTAWSLLVVNVVLLGVGTWITSRLATELGLPAIFGLAFALNPGVFASLLIDSAEVLAMLFFVLAALLALRARYAWATAALTLAALSREAMLLAAAGVIAYLIFRKVPIRWYMASPFVVTIGWWIYLRAKIGFLDSGVQDTQAIGAPFVGFADAIGSWLTTDLGFIDLVMGFALMAIAILIAWRTLKSRSLIGLMASGFSLVAVLMVEPVWRNYFDSARVLAPLITAYILMIPPSIRRAGSVQHRHAGASA